MSFLIKSNKFKKPIQFIKINKKAWNIVKIIYFQVIFLFTNNIWRIVDINSKYLVPNITLIILNQIQ